MLHDDGICMSLTEAVLLAKQSGLVRVCRLTQLLQQPEPVSHGLAVLLLDRWEVFRTLAGVAGHALRLRRRRWWNHSPTSQSSSAIRNRSVPEPSTRELHAAIPKKSIEHRRFICIERRLEPSEFIDEL
jgi:hypothetical protein